MAFTEFYMQTTGSNLNAGSTNADAASLTYASGSWVQSTRVFTVASGNPVTDGVAVGDWVSVYPDGNTVTPFIGQVTARDATTITISSTISMGTAPTNGTANRTLKVGGAWANFLSLGSGSPFISGNVPLSMRINCKAGTYSHTSSTISCSAGTTGQNALHIRGYRTAIGDLDDETVDSLTGGVDLPLVTFTTGRIVISGTGAVYVSNLDLTGAPANPVLQVAKLTNSRVKNTNAASSSAAALTASGSSVYVVNCDIEGTSLTATVLNVTGSLVVVSGCTVREGGTGIRISGGTSSISRCIVDSPAVDGIAVASAISAILQENTIYDCGRDGVRYEGTEGTLALISDCVFSVITGTAINAPSSVSAPSIRMTHNLFHSVGQRLGSLLLDVVDLYVFVDSSTPFVTPGTDFTLVESSNGRGNASSSWLGSTIDIGAIQYSVAPVPTTPSLTVADNLDGTATITITGSDSASTNTVLTQSVLGSSFASAGSRTGDGTVVLMLDPGRYFVYVQSTVSSSTAISEVDTLRMGDLAAALTHSPADIIGALLVSLGLGTDPEAAGSWPVNVSNEPTDPDSCITVYDTSGRTEGRFQTSGETQEHQGIQIRVRAADHATAWTKIHAILNTIDTGVYDEIVAVESESYLVHNVTRTGGVLSLGKEDSSDRRLFTLNAIVSVRQLD